jgi:hypothetical protein
MQKMKYKNEKPRKKWTKISINISLRGPVERS